MNVFLDVLRNYWKEIISLLLFIGSIIIAIIRKKPVNDILSYIYEFAVKAVNDAENFKVVIGSGESSMTGKGKLSFAVTKVREALKNNFPDLDVAAYEPLIVSIIEGILSTPQKKGR